MWTILVSLIIGIIIGIKKFIPDKFVKYNSKFQQIGIILLLFSMGASIGANKEVLYNLKTMGLKALTFAATTTVFSVLIVYFISTKFMRSED